MRMRRMRSHPDFKLEGRSRHFQSFWELELTPGEQTTPHQHYESEEIIYLLNGKAQVIVADVERSVRPGEVVLVPPRTDHVIANPSDHVLRAITVESRLDLGARAEEQPQVSSVELSAEGLEGSLRAEEEAKRSTQTIDELMNELPQELDEAVAIKTIVELFNVGGELSEKIEQTVGLDNTRGLEALNEVERKIMGAVVEISTRYRRPGGGRSSWFLG